jgi:deoxycytidylate deaminase
MLSKHDQKIMNMTRRLAIAVTPIKSSKIAATLAIKSDIISIGKCEMRSHPFQAKFSKNPDAIFFHAETSAIYNALKVVKPEALSKSTLFVHRVKRPAFRSIEWIDGNACPCEGCKKAISKFSIKKVVYSTDDSTYNILT